MQKYNQVNDYILSVCNQIRSKRAHAAIKKEICDHIEDQKNAFVSDGQDEETAINNAIREMGDPVSVGEQLDGIHRPKPEKSIIAVVAILIFLQLLSVNFFKAANFELREYLISIIVGILGMSAVYFVDYSRIVKYSTLIYILLAILNIFLDTLLLRAVNVSLDYYFTLMMIVAFSGVIINLKSKGYKGFVTCILLFGVGIITMVKIRSMSCLLLFCIGVSTLILTACLKNVFKVNKKLVITIFVSGIALFGLFLLFIVFHNKGYSNDRLNAIFNPYEDPTGAGYMRVLTRELLTNSSFIGETSSFESRKLPIGTDYQLTYFITKYGYIVGIVVVGIIAFLIIRMFISTLKQKNQQGMFISLGCSIVILIQAVFYILANLGYEIIATISLPLLSYGKAGFIVNMLIIGIMLCTYRNENILERK